VVLFRTWAVITQNNEMEGIHHKFLQEHFQKINNKKADRNVNKMVRAIEQPCGTIQNIYI
jgi:hypothetical protein